MDNKKIEGKNNKKLRELWKGNDAGTKGVNFWEKYAISPNRMMGHDLAYCKKESGSKSGCPFKKLITAYFLIYSA